jgi:uncharacterized protein (TIGR00297 family)
MRCSYIRNIGLALFYVELFLINSDAFNPTRIYHNRIVSYSIRNGSIFRCKTTTTVANDEALDSTNRRVKTSHLALLYGIDTHEVISSVFRSTGQVPLIQAFTVNAVLFTLARQKLLSALTPSGYMHAMLLGTMLWKTLGWKGWLYCVLYLILGQGVTKVGFAKKEKLGIAESRGGRRGPENVWGSAATSLICAILYSREVSFFDMNRKLLLLGFVAALATKLADTFASEIGKAYGKTTFLITTLERVKPGTEGAISAEGTAAAALGGLLLSTFGYFLGFINFPSICISTMAAFVATNAESLIGATIQGKKGFGFMTNEVVNFVNTFIGGVLAIVVGRFILHLT